MHEDILSERIEGGIESHVSDESEEHVAEHECVEVVDPPLEAPL